MRPLASAFAATLVVAGTLRAQAYVPATDLPNGKEIVAVYVGAKTCGPCQTPEVKDAIQRMKTLLAAQAKQSGAAFSVVGVSTDWSVKDGAEFLEPNGPFDQVVVGGNWTNLGAEQYLWRDSTARPSMPTVLIFERTVKPGVRITFSESRLIRQVTNEGKGIAGWVAEGAPISPPKKP
jgi:hypothetical protein